MDRRLSGPQSRPGHSGEEKNSQTLPGHEPPISAPYMWEEGEKCFMILFKW